MALTVGTDSYISLADAETYISENYISTEAKAVAWAALSDGNKEILLRKACKKIDRQLYTGIKAEDSQSLEFPRAIRTNCRREAWPLLNVYFDSDWIIQTETPEAVKSAQAEEAISLAKGTPKRLELQAQGVKSFSIGGSLSESYSGPSSITLSSQEAIAYLKPYLLGAAAIA
jgi:hypothetical protein